MKMLLRIAGLGLATMLTACGGGGGSPGTTVTGATTSTSSTATPTTSTPATVTPTTSVPSTTTTTATTAVASFIYQLDKQALNNSGADKAVLTVTALDASNNPVKDSKLTVAVDTGIYTPTSSSTDASGSASGVITIGANKANRNINASINLAGRTATAVIAVSGSQISLTPVPATPAPGQSVRLDMKVVDSTGAGVPSTPVQLSGTLGFTQSLVTDLNGNASATLGAAPAAGGTYQVDAQALGVTGSRTIQVVSGAGGGIPNAIGTISAASLAITPNTISPNVTGATTSRATLRARFLNSTNSAVQNVRVRFEILAPALGSGEQISTGTAVVYSDVNGEAVAEYIPGTRSSPTNGVRIRACYGVTDADLASGSCASSVIQTLTVASQPLAITLGDNNELAKGNSNLTYIKKFDVAVADSAGNAVANAVVSASVDITHFGKGPFLAESPSPKGTYQVTGDSPPNSETTGFSTSAIPSTAAGRVWCPNEDTNRNGSLDTGPSINEDINFNGRLEPRKADVILSFVGSNVTGSTGRMTIQVEYPQNVATWLAYTVRVTTSVAGSEGTDSKSYITSFVKGDEVNGSFLTPPHGINRCLDVN